MTSAMSKIHMIGKGFADVASSGKTWNHVNLHLDFILKYLASSGDICDHLGSCVSISAHLGSSAIILHPLESSSDSFEIP